MKMNICAGDNRNQSEDSRFADMGNVKLEDIEGKVWAVFISFGITGDLLSRKVKNMNYQWYPGHMTKARRMMQEDIKLIDLVIELLDARVPFSSRNPDIDKMGRDKARLILLNKSDLADEKSNEAWVAFFEAKGYCVRKINSRSGAGLKSINAAVLEACHEKIERDKRKGIQEPSGAGNGCRDSDVGKSTFINAYAGKHVQRPE